MNNGEFHWQRNAREGACLCWVYSSFMDNKDNLIIKVHSWTVYTTGTIKLKRYSVCVCVRGERLVRSENLIH